MGQELTGAWKLKAALAAAVGQSPQPFMGTEPHGLMVFGKNKSMSLTIVPQVDPAGVGPIFTAGGFEVTRNEETATGAFAIDFDFSISVAGDPDLVDEVRGRSVEIAPDGRALTMTLRDYYVPGSGKLDVQLFWDKL